jgi:hypothetical protein
MSSDGKDLEVRDAFDASRLAEEARRRWGDTAAFKESRRREARYTQAAWCRIRAETETIERRMVAAYDRHGEPSAHEAMEIAEASRLAIDRWFYRCTPAMHVTLGEMYLSDERFRRHYDGLRVGLAAWLCSAIEANAERQTSGST